MTLVAFSHDGFLVTFRLPSGVSEEKFTGALLARMSAPVVNGPPKGSGAGAKCAPVRTVTGAPPAPLPSEGGPDARRVITEKVEYYREEIRSLSAEKVALAPDFDSHEATLKTVREILADNHASAPVNASAEIREARIALHDRLLQASIDWGKQARRYREVKSMIENLSTEVERLVAKASKA